MLQTHWEAGVHILACCCSSQRVLDAVRYAGRRFDGRGAAAPVGGDDLPLESRMIAIVDAFDQITANPAAGNLRTREACFEELFAGAGTLFSFDLGQSVHRTAVARPGVADAASRWAVA